jgi:hypothetical protein
MLYSPLNLVCALLWHMQTRPDTSCAFRTGTSLYLQILEVFQLCARGVQEELDLCGLHRISGDREQIVCNREMPYLVCNLVGLHLVDAYDLVPAVD